jgi:hypothetical protein
MSFLWKLLEDLGEWYRYQFVGKGEYPDALAGDE